MKAAKGILSTKKLLFQKYSTAVKNNQVEFIIDYVLTSIERLYWFMDTLSTFSKPRAMLLIGLAAGFIITPEDIINCKCTASISNLEIIQQQNKFEQSKKSQQLLNKHSLPKSKQILQMLSYRNQDCHQDRRLLKDFNYERIINYDQNINSEPQLYLNQNDEELPNFNWEDYFLDFADMKDHSELIKKYAQDKCNKENQVSDRQQLFIEILNLIGLNTTMDPRTDHNINDLLSAQKKWRIICYEETQFKKLQLLLDIYKYNYNSIIDQDMMLVDEDIQGTNIYYGLLGLQGIHYKRNILYADLQKYINSCIWLKKSNQINIAQILSIFSENFEDISCLTSQTTSPDVLLNFIQLSLGLNKEYQYRQLKTIVDKTSLNTFDQKVLYESILIYFGEVLNLSELVLPIQYQDPNIQSTTKLLLTILYGFDRQELHRYDGIQWNSFNFYKTTRLTLDPKISEQAFTTLIWQLAQSVTQQTLPEDLQLPILSENQIRLNNDQSKQYHNVNLLIKPIQQFIIDLLEGDYSCFFRDDIQHSLERLQIVSSDGNKSQIDLGLIQALLGLKTEKILAVMPKLNNQNKNIMIQTQMQTLVRCKVIQINTQQQDTLKEKQQSEQIARLFLGISYNSIHDIVEAIFQSDATTGSYIIALYCWKNLPQISQRNLRMEVFKESFELLPTMIYSLMNSTSQGSRQPFSSDCEKLIIKIQEQKPTAEFYYQIQIHSQRLEQQQYQLYWTLWTTYLQRFKQSEVYPIIQFITGLSIFERISTTKYDSLLKSYFVPEIFFDNENKFSYQEAFIEQQKLNQKFISVFNIQGMNIIQIFLDIYYFQQIPNNKDTFKENKSLKSMDTQSFEQKLRVLHSCFYENVIMKEMANNPRELKENIGKLLQEYQTKLIKKQYPRKQGEVDAQRQIISQFEIISKQPECLLITQEQQYFLENIKPEFPTLVQKIQMLHYKMQNQGQINKLIEQNLFLIFDLLFKGGSAEGQIKIMQELVDKLLFQSLKIDQYINTDIMSNIYATIESVARQPIKQINNPEYIKSILLLLCQITGQTVPQEIQTLQMPNFQVNSNRVKFIELPMDFIYNIFQLSAGNLLSIPNLLKDLKLSHSTIRIVQNSINQIQSIGVFGQLILPQAQSQETKKTQEIQELMKKIEQGIATATDMFKAIDTDGSNSISKQEFNVLSRRLGMNLSEHRTDEIFAAIKISAADQNLNETEFQKAMTYLQSKNTNMALNFLGISPSILTMWLIMLAATLFMIFVFIFFGIQAFALGGTFGAIINSILPMIAGAGASTKTEKLGEKDISETPVTEVVEKTQKIIQSDQI